MRADSCSDFDRSIDFSSFIEIRKDLDEYNQLEVFSDLISLYEDGDTNYPNISILNVIYNNTDKVEPIWDYTDTCIFDIFAEAGQCD